MTTDPYLDEIMARISTSPDSDATPADPGAIDLDGFGQRYVAEDPGGKAGMVIDLIAAVEALRETNARLNRRCQTYEAGVAEKVREFGGSLGRSLARAAWQKSEVENEALRARVVALEKDLAESESEAEHYLRLAIVDPGSNNQVSWKARAEAAEVCVAALAGALEWFDNHAKALAADLKSAHFARGDAASEWMREDDKELRAGLSKAIEQARATLTTTPEKAMERARAVKECVTILRRLVDLSRRENWPTNADFEPVEDALAKLDALGKEDGDV